MQCWSAARKQFIPNNIRTIYKRSSREIKQILNKEAQIDNYNISLLRYADYMTCNTCWILSTPGAENGNYELIRTPQGCSLLDKYNVDRKEATLIFI